MDKGENALAPVRKTAAEQIIDLVGMVSGLAQDTANRTAAKLSPIMNDPTPTEGKDEVRVSYPPFFEEVRQSLESIRSSIYLINNCLDRTEI